ncbi:MAG: hypothetical protein KDE14_09195 [Rhodobacteraceae bacterium]|nr:hypothetical protein [Paracoccaceae bacterium]
MTLIRRLYFSLVVLGALGVSAAAHATIIGSFSGHLVLSVPNELNRNLGVVDGFALNDLFGGSFAIDDSVLPTGTNQFPGALTSLSGAVNGLGFSLSGGNVQQLLAGATEIITFGVGSGSLAGPTVNGFDLSNLTFDLRGSDLYDAINVLPSSLSVADLSYRRVTFTFNNGSTNRYLVGLIDSFTWEGAPSAGIPAPSGLALFLLGTGLLVRIRGRKSK